MTDQTTDTPAPTPETETPAETAARRGRGPTRPALVAADLVSDLSDADADEDVVNTFLDSTLAGETGKDMLAEARRLRKAMEEQVRTVEASIRRITTAAAYVATWEKLPPRLQALVRAAMSSPPVAGPEVPEGEGA